MKKVGNYKDMSPYYNVELVDNVGLGILVFQQRGIMLRQTKRIQNRDTNTEGLRREQIDTSLTQNRDR